MALDEKLDSSAGLTVEQRLEALYGLLAIGVCRVLQRRKRASSRMLRFLIRRPTKVVKVTFRFKVRKGHEQVKRVVRLVIQKKLRCQNEVY